MLREHIAERHHPWDVAVELVHIAMVMAVDDSGSISSEDLALRFRDNTQALTNDAFMNSERSGRYGRIAFQSVEKLLQAPDPLPGFTSISGAFDFSRQMLTACGYATERQVIDVAGDATDNDGHPLMEAGSEAIDAGIAVNGLPIVRCEPNISTYYSGYVVGGEASFIIVAKDTSSFHIPASEKFVTEIVQVSLQSHSG